MSTLRDLFRVFAFSCGIILVVILCVCCESKKHPTNRQASSATLVGTWILQFQQGNEMRVLLRTDGTFVQEIRNSSGHLIAESTGTWRVKDGWIILDGALKNVATRWSRGMMAWYIIDSDDPSRPFDISGSEDGDPDSFRPLGFTP